MIKVFNGGVKRNKYIFIDIYYKIIIDTLFIFIILFMVNHGIKIIEVSPEVQERINATLGLNSVVEKQSNKAAKQQRH